LLRSSCKKTRVELEPDNPRMKILRLRGRLLQCQPQPHCDAQIENHRYQQQVLLCKASYTSRLDRAREEIRASATRTNTCQAQALDPVMELNIFLSGEMDGALATLVDDNPQDPKTWTEAMQSKDKHKWKKGMDKEMGSIRDWKVWKLISPAQVPKGRKVIGCRPVCHIK
jgi:hypothetical protein